jgi:transposase-like protein
LERGGQPTRFFTDDGKINGWRFVHLTERRRRRKGRLSQPSSQDGLRQRRRRRKVKVPAILFQRREIDLDPPVYKLSEPSPPVSLPFSSC